MLKLDICPDCAAKIEAENITIFGDVIDALKDVIASADPTKIAGLRETIDSFSRDCPEDYYWSIGGRSPSMLNDLIHHIEIAVDVEIMAAAEIADSAQEEMIADKGANVGKVVRATVAAMVSENRKKRSATQTRGEKRVD